MSLGPGTVEATRRELIARGLALAGTRSDADRLSAMLRAEQVLVFTYEQVLASGVLPGELRTTAAQFLGHERAHVDALAHELSRVGGTRPRRPAAYGPLGRLTAGGAMRLLIELERAAISVYYTEMSSIQDPNIAHTAAAIMANEAQHATELRELLSPGDIARSVPAALVYGTR